MPLIEEPIRGGSVPPDRQTGSCVHRRNDRTNVVKRQRTRAPGLDRHHGSAVDAGAARDIDLAQPRPSTDRAQQVGEVFVIELAHGEMVDRAHGEMVDARLDVRLRAA